ncbi:MAG TPA: TatD family hydrolase [Candidatus Paceibacterota bacterium]|nr:TatD family hydrolase [Candidatus Paceibacterota bacterium]
MKTHYIDAHCHLQFEQFADDREDIISQMQEQGVAAIVVGCDFESSQKAVVLAEKHEHLYAAIGLHPTDAGGEHYAASAYRALAAHKKVIAIGECGLDYFRPEEVTDAVKDIQKDIFKEHIQLAAERNLPLIIHARPSKGTQDAYEDVIKILEEEKRADPRVRGDIHFFVGGIREAEAFIALGFTVSFTAVITFAREYDAVVRAIPLTSILGETDAPYVAPLARRGKRNDPLAVIAVVEKIAELRGEDPDLVRTTLAGNTRRVFSLP